MFVKKSAIANIKVLRNILLTGVLLVLFVSVLGINPGFAQDGTEKVEVEQVWKQFMFFSKGAENPKWMQDRKSICVTDEQKDMYVIDIENTQNAKKILEGKALNYQGSDIGLSEFVFSKDESKLLLFSEMKSIYRHSASFVAYVYDLKEKKMTQVANGKRIKSPALSPDGQSVSYVLDNNLYVQTISEGRTQPLTSDGKWNFIINGHADWVYEEEFTLTNGYEWSPDSKYIAYYRFDESKVPEYTLVEYPDSAYPNLYNYKYPKAGDANSVVDIYVYDIQKRLGQKVDLGTEKDQYIPRIYWTKSGNQLAVIRMNRLQNQADVLLADARTGQAKLLFTEKSDTYISEINDQTLTFLNDGKQFIWQSERDGYNHLYLYDLSGKVIRPLTQGKWEVTEFYGVNDIKQLAYFQSAAQSPLERQIYAVPISGGETIALAAQAGWNDAEFGVGCSYFVNTHSSASLPPTATLNRETGEQVILLKDNADMLERMSRFQLAPKEFFSFKTSEGVELNGYWLKPAKIKKKAKLPVLMFVYGGPGSQLVANKYDGAYYFWFQHFVDRGYMVVCVDNRGTGGRGAAFKKSTYADMGKQEAQDQIEAAKWLATQANVDPARIGIWGWSFGGYLSSLCLLLGNDVFKTAVAVAPVTNWRFYDTIYTERYLKKPQDNPLGYDMNSPISYADRLKGNYLIIHGMSDDNVHPQNSMRMIEELVDKNQTFDVMVYPDQNHGLSAGNARIHVFNKITGYILGNL